MLSLKRDPHTLPQKVQRRLRKAPMEALGPKTNHLYEALETREGT